MNLKILFQKLKQDTNSITINPLLNCFEQEDLNTIDIKSLSDEFIAEKKKNILNLIKDHRVDFNPKLKSAFDEYTEALTYLLLKKKFESVERFPESDSKTPDFKIEFTAESHDEGVKKFTVYAELKSMSFAANNLNYKDAMEQGLKTHIDIEQQLKRGNQVGFGITEVQPLHNNKENYDPTSTRYATEILIDKIAQNLKEDQFSKGETVLIVNLKQLSLPSYFIEGAVPVFQEKRYGSNVSGVQWHVAFGKAGYLMFKPIEFEGKENTDDELEKDGILIHRHWIKAIIFLDYKMSDKKPKVVGLYREREGSEAIEIFLNKFCHFINDNKNSHGFVLSCSSKA